VFTAKYDTPGGAVVIHFRASFMRIIIHFLMNQANQNRENQKNQKNQGNKRTDQNRENQRNQESGKTSKTSRSPKPAKPRKLEISEVEKFSQKAGTNPKNMVEYKIEHQMKQNKLRQKIGG
jgi:hypothetical protein